MASAFRLFVMGLVALLLAPRTAPRRRRREPRLDGRTAADQPPPPMVLNTRLDPDLVAHVKAMEASWRAAHNAPQEQETWPAQPPPQLFGDREVCSVICRVCFGAVVLGNPNRPQHVQCDACGSQHLLVPIRGDEDHVEMVKICPGPRWRHAPPTSEPAGA